MAADQRFAKTEQMTEVQKQMIHKESVLKERAALLLYENYTVNPCKKHEYLAGKPNSIDEARELLQGKTDTDFLQIIARNNLEPTKKYLEPQTEAQEIGWMTKPLLDSDRNDRRLNFFRKRCEITKHWEEMWRDGTFTKRTPRQQAS